MRVLLAPSGSRGDVQPLLALGQRLRARGHTVRAAITPDFVEWVASLGIEPIPGGPSVLALSHELGARVRNPVVFMRLLARWLPEQFTALREAVGRGTDLVIGGGAQGAAASVAEWAGVEYRYVVYTPQLLPSSAHGPMMLARQGLPAPLNAMAWRLTEAAWVAAFGGLFARERRKMGLDPWKGPLYAGAITGDREVFVASDPNLAPAPRDWRFPHLQTGAFHLDDPAELPPRVEEFLATPGPRVVYVGFGSMEEDDARESTRRIVEATRRAGVRAVIASGWAGLGVNDVLPRHCLLVDAVPHAKLFPRLAAVVHHGGAGTTHAALRAGVPQLLVPHLLDQYFWGARTHRLGVAAPPVPVSRMTAERLAAGIRAALEPERARRARLEGARERAIDGAAAACERLETILVGERRAPRRASSG